MQPRIRIVWLAVALAVAAPGAVYAQPKVFRAVEKATLEKVLADLKIEYKRIDPKEKDLPITHYDFTRSSIPCRLTNYGSDLWIEWQIERKLPLDDINRWNAQAKFTRAVLVTQPEKTTTSLEAQLDCLGGVTEAMIRQFINRFDDDASKFAKTLPK